MTTPTPHGAPELLPCPFCGAVGVTVSETSTFRWVAAVCESCGAVGPEARRDTMKQWPNEAEDTAKAIKEWNTRAAIQQAAGAVPEGWQDLIDELETAAGRITQYSNSPLDGLLQAAADALRDKLRASGKPVKVFGLTKGGDPLHPLFLGYDTQLIDWCAAAQTKEGPT